MTTLFVDPGIATNGGTGAAYFGTDGELVQAWLFRGVKGENPLHRVAAQFRGLQILKIVDTLVFEWPQVYGGRAQKNPNDLLPLAAVCGYLSAFAPGATLNTVLPRQWKGTLDGDTMTRRIESLLTPEEKERIVPCPASLRHNVLDAVGMGLWWFGRLERKRVIHR